MKTIHFARAIAAALIMAAIAGASTAAMADRISRQVRCFRSARNSRIAATKITAANTGPMQGRSQWSHEWRVESVPAPGFIQSKWPAQANIARGDPGAGASGPPTPGGHSTWSSRS